MSIDTQVGSFRRILWRRVMLLKVGFRAVAFAETSLLSVSLVFVVGAAVVALNKVRYVPSVVHSRDTLFGALLFAALFSFLWAFLVPVKDQSVARAADKELGVLGQLESAVDFMERPHDVDALYLKLFMERTAPVLASIGIRDVIKADLSKVAIGALASLVLFASAVNLLPDRRLLTREDHPFVIQDIQRLSREMRATLQGIDEGDPMDPEQRRLFEEAERVSRLMGSNVVDPDYLREQLSRLSRNLDGHRDSLQLESDEAIERLLYALQAMEEVQGVQADPRRRQLLEDMAEQARQVSQSSMSDRSRGVDEMSRLLNRQNEDADGWLSPEEARSLNQMLRSVEEISENYKDARDLSSVVQSADRTVRRGTGQDTLAEDPRSRDWQRRSLMPSDETPTDYGGSDEGDTDRFAARPNGDSDSYGSGEGEEFFWVDGFEIGEGDNGEVTDDLLNGVGAGDEEGDLVYGQRTPGLDVDPRHVDHEWDESEDFGIGTRTILGEPTRARPGFETPSDLGRVIDDGFEGEIDSTEYPQKYRDIITNYFDGL